MVVDATGHFVSQREQRRLALVDVRLTDDGIVIAGPGMEPLPVRIPGPGGDADFESDIWGDAARVRPAAREAGEWLSTFLGVAVRLVHQPDEATRVMRREYAGAIGGPRRTTLSDGAPLLLTGESSLDDLNARLTTPGTGPLAMNRFRPNVVVRGAPAFAEDGWVRLAIGDVRFEVAKPCARCVTTTVNQETAERGAEPLRTLATYRKAPPGVLFGQNIAHHAPGVVRVGDEVRVIARAPGPST